tara:strand:- start:979 stop:1623 length:645 start_codon:yes stop_codon:yes gene_type:complete
MALDKINALSGPPGHSLTDTPKKWSWEQPPKDSNPDAAIDSIIEKMENTNTHNDMIKMMFAGVSIEEIVTQIGFKGFMEGAFNPDVAELIKPSLTLYLLGLAQDQGFNPKVYAGKSDDPKIEDEVTDDTMFKIMQQRNPELFAAMLEKENEDQRMLDAVAQEEGVEQEQNMAMEQQLSNSFMGTPQDVIMDAELEEEEEEPVPEEQIIQEERVV